VYSLHVTGKPDTLILT